MTSFFGRLKATTNPSSPAGGGTPTKKDPNAPPPTPLEKLLADRAGPTRTDGSDKFFGFENVVRKHLVYYLIFSPSELFCSPTSSYCNSIIQCLYYSAPFREQVVNFPTRSAYDALNRNVNGLPRLNTDTSNANGAGSALSPTKKAITSTPASQASPRGKAPPTPGSGGPQGFKPEENKDSPEYKKKLALSAGPVLTMDYENSLNYGMTESLFTSLKDIFETIIAHPSRIGVVAPHKFLEILRRDNEMFRTPMHQDAHEFLNLLLNQVVESVEEYSKLNGASTPKATNLENGFATALEKVTSLIPNSILNTNADNAGWVHDLFEGTLTSETRCLTCENVSQRDEVFLDLSVDLEEHSSVTSCLRKFSEEEMLCERNKFHCDICGGLQEAEKRMKIKKSPRILALHLKRFKYTEDMQRLHKLFHRVMYPYYLRLFNTTDDAENPDRLYELYAVVIHIGNGPYHGHYVSIIKTQDRGWLLFDDEMVEPVDKSYVRNFFGGLQHNGQPHVASAYVLFYQETTEEAMRKEQEAEGAAAAEQISNLSKEAIPIPSEHKMNGFLPNGGPNHVTPATPVFEEQDHFASLNHAATQNVASINHTPFAPLEAPLEHSHTFSGMPVGLGMGPAFSPSLNGKKSMADVMQFKKKDRQKEDKERKAAEKELEKQAKAKKKEMEMQRKELNRKHEDDMKAALAASRMSGKAGPGTGMADEERRLNDGSPATTAGAMQDSAGGGGYHHLPPAAAAATTAASTSSPSKENGVLGHGLNRFRPSSLTLRGKTKFWKDKHDAELKDVANTQEGLAHDHHGGEGSQAKEGGVERTDSQKEKDKEKGHGKNRFSLGRKKSTIGLL
ncbi:cysteine proteinase [Aulographum hederae CBS 113979]|uniref:ubiquitinyl hydrolase 1 n=1 Tax=Aulographum hederae CBS 113979 TaxID=1176131 RepID=A0A6G1GYY8_9PEZI|nr:cysteine proteinase [Aulographum hederae CBS 113979]